MSAERKKVLEMLAEGTISADEAEKLLDKLGAAVSDEAAPNQKAASGPAAAPKKPRFLRIVVERPGQDHVNIRMPISLTRTGKLLAILPSRIGERLAEHGIDLSALSAMNEQELSEAMENINIDVDRGNGKKVRIFCE
jgi:SHOCT-like protein